MPVRRTFARRTPVRRHITTGREIVNTTLTASQEKPWKHLALSCPQDHHRLTVELPHQEQMRRRSVTDRLSLRLGLWLLLRAQRRRRTFEEQHLRLVERKRLLDDYESQRLRQYTHSFMNLR